MPVSSTVVTYPVYDKVPNSESRVGEFSDKDGLVAAQKVIELTSEKNRRMISAELLKRFRK